jgi:hypothetical protein
MNDGIGIFALKYPCLSGSAKCEYFEKEEGRELLVELERYVPVQI